MYLFIGLICLVVLLWRPAFQEVKVLRPFFTFAAASLILIVLAAMYTGLASKAFCAGAIISLVISIKCLVSYFRS
jgi:hypothetical protein